MVSTAAYRKLYLARYILLHIFIRNDPSKNLTLCGTYEQCSKYEKKGHIQPDQLQFLRFMRQTERQIISHFVRFLLNRFQKYLTKCEVLFWAVWAGCRASELQRIKKVVWLFIKFISKFISILCNSEALHPAQTAQKISRQPPRSKL